MSHDGHDINLKAQNTLNLPDKIQDVLHYQQPRDASGCCETTSCQEADQKAVVNLPPEILSEIFKRCCPTYNDRYRGPPFTALTLSHVCRLWQRVALDTPAIWTYMNMTVDYSTETSLNTAEDQLMLWLGCVQNCPIVIDAEYVENPERVAACNVFDHVKSIIDLILALKPSLDPNEMDLRAALDASAGVSSPGDDSHPLVAEQYSWAKSGMRPDRPDPGTVQLHVNRYAELIYGIEGHSTLGPYLKHLNLRDPQRQIRLSVEECQIALANFQQLEFCAMHIGESEDEEVEAIQLTHLRTLSLSWTDGVEVAPLIDSITTPALEQLELKGPLDVMSSSSSRQSSRHKYWSPSSWERQLSKSSVVQSILPRLSAQRRGLDRRSLENGEGPAREQDRRVIRDLNFLALVSCDIFALDDFLRDASADPLAWEGANLKKLYIIDCGYISEEVLDAMRRLPFEQFETDPEVLEDESLDLV
ncbi:uncharacterized protein FOMMEDRAFT_31945 [Fomitiporia mediterranea MF3/22]|uniref:uncharacterized protein n=1 Tax=Fomitiporia mediterranea (strain MF3/22) TaxID=694068 RepID=UPI00044092F9|nr:uncharacterized protein FOMMEDRAFT_31945 [Fomitiporia mediterranea MF3/22]EJC98168.1 hypothetical protein FOMMEDRAFT_31945 [Fomitiporia mediterranea MF3/22]